MYLAPENLGSPAVRRRNRSGTIDVGLRRVAAKRHGSSGSGFCGAPASARCQGTSRRRGITDRLIRRCILLGFAPECIRKAWKATAFDWDHLTDHHASILEAYFALYQERDPATIGSGEILRWFRERAPSEALIRTVLAAVQAPRRGGGRPALTTRADASPPLSTVRTNAPRPRDARHPGSLRPSPGARRGRAPHDRAGPRPGPSRRRRGAPPTRFRSSCAPTDASTGRATTGFGSAPPSRSTTRTCAR